jgi:hypothetical protein
MLAMAHRLLRANHNHRHTMSSSEMRKAQLTRFNEPLSKQGLVVKSSQRKISIFLSAMPIDKAMNAND